VPTALAGLLAGLALFGCARIHVTAESRIGKDGSIQRKISFLHAGGPSLEELYRLPRPPAWSVTDETITYRELSLDERLAFLRRFPRKEAFQAQVKKKPPRRYRRYTARRTYRPGEPPASDYVKLHPEAQGLAARNSISLTIKKGLFGSTIVYRETFQEASDPEALRRILFEAAKKEISMFIEDVARAYPGKAPWEELKRRELRDASRKLEGAFGAWRSIQDQEGLRVAQMTFRRFEDWLDSLPGRLAKKTSLDEKKLKELLDEVEKKAEDKEAERLLMRALGAHLAEGDFSFTLIVHMPGVIVRASTEEYRGTSSAVCRFRAEYFLLEPYSCQVEAWVPEVF
jgi:hypothetical protein